MPAARARMDVHHSPSSRHRSAERVRRAAFAHSRRRRLLIVQLRQLGRLLALPLILAAICAYFGHHALYGERGLIMRDVRLQQIAAARSALAEVLAERDLMERKVAGLRGSGLDRDLLDERARALLNSVARNDLVMPYAGPERLF